MVIQAGVGFFNCIQIRLNNHHSTESNLKKAEAIFKKYNPSIPSNIICR